MNPFITSNELHRAEIEIQESNLKLDEAFEHLQFKLDHYAHTYNKFSHLVKNPFALLATAFATGIFFGKMISLSFSQKRYLK